MSEDSENRTETPPTTRTPSSSFLKNITNDVMERMTIRQRFYNLYS